MKTPFLDLLFNMLLGFVLLFFVSFMMIKPILKQAELRKKAEYIITVTWPSDSRDDVDTWLENPNKEITWYRDKENSAAHLDRDDLGSANDTIVMSGGVMKILPINQEITTIRGFIPGEWVLNIHMYSKRDTTPTDIKVVIDKLNPKFESVFNNTYTISEKWTEITVSRFTMTASGEILSWSDLPKQLIKLGI